MNIYVGNLSYSLTDSELRNAFAEFGDVSSVNILTDRDTGQASNARFLSGGHPIMYANIQYHRR